jgi:hypothetical protein
MSLYYKRKNQQNRTGLSTLRLADELIPRETPLNIIKNFPWTLTPKNSLALNETPYIKLKEYYLLDGALNQLLQAYNQSISLTDSQGNRAVFGGALDIAGLLANPASLIGQARQSNRVYEGVYNLTDPTGFEYIFPYFENPTNIQNNWAAKSSYEAMLQLQRTLAQVEATLIYYNLAPINAPAAAAAGLAGYTGTPAGMEQWLNDMTTLLAGGYDASGQLDPRALTPLTVELAAKGGERLPYLGQFAQRVRQTMVDLNIFQVDVDRTMEQLNIALRSATGNIGSDPVLDKPHIWNSSQPRVFNISFPLYNIVPTTDDNWSNLLSRNWQLCYTLTYQNLYNKRNLFTGIPPVFYEVEVPGVYYTKAGYVNSLTILNIGNTRQVRLPVKDDGGIMTVNMPDAYIVNMSVIDFFMPSRNFLDTINNPTRRNIIRSSS